MVDASTSGGQVYHNVVPKVTTVIKPTADKVNYLWAILLPLLVFYLIANLVKWY